MGVPYEDHRLRRLFMRSLNPMLIVDDERRYVDANPAASLFLRLPLEEIRKLRIDDVTAPELRAGLDELWAEFLSGEGIDALGWDFHMPGGTSVTVDLCSTAHFQPGRHLAIIVFPPARTLNERLAQTQVPDSQVLSKREREVLTLVALGYTGVQIADQLYIAPATVQTHMANTLIKLGAKNRAHGIAIALQTGELALGDEPDEPEFPGPQTSPPDARG
jgi:DNA-binding CsgD family transcriptional regulator